MQVIAATNRNVEKEVAAGRFREDLLFRINTVHLQVPPLRERSEDIPEFLAHFSRYHAERLGRPTWRPDDELLSRLCRYAWPGNMRQLAQFVERRYVFGDRVEDVIAELVHGLPEIDALKRAPPEPPVRQPMPTGDPVLPILDLDDLRRIAVRQALAASRGRRCEAAKLLGVCRNTVTKLIAEACPEAAVVRLRQPKGSRG
jgi:DNA-binding NtrC family response regulator